MPTRLKLPVKKGRGFYYSKKETFPRRLQTQAFGNPDLTGPSLPFPRLLAQLPAMSSLPLLGDSEPPAALLGDIKTEPPEELLAEPVDLSVHKTKPPPPPQNPLSCFRSAAPPAAPPAVAALGSASSAIPAVLSPGSILASSQGSGGQQILHVIHTIPSFQLPGKMGKLQTIPLVVQSLPVVYAAMPADGVAAAAVTVPLIGGDGKDAGSGEGTAGWLYRSWQY
nr:Krueppel-like factor 8 [Zootoca vivipara]